MCPATDNNAAQGDLDQPECSGYLLTVPKARAAEIRRSAGASAGRRKLFQVRKHIE